MALIKSISGTRGTIGGKAGQNLTAHDIVESASAYAQWILGKNTSPKVVVGRDARISGEIVSSVICATLQMMGVDVINIGLSTTPTVEMAVVSEQADGGIVISASHNPKEWNALKLLNEKGEFISAEVGATIIQLAKGGEITYADVEQLGSYKYSVGHIQKHIDAIFALEEVDSELVVEKGYKVVVDCINSTGMLSIVPLLEQMGCEVIPINEEINGRFAHNPEPLPVHLSHLSEQVVYHKADLGVAVDPDVDRLAFVSEDGSVFGEEYTLVAVADYILSYQKGNTVSNLSSTQALRDITEKHGGTYHASAVGEVNVVHKMKETNAVIGGEGNGGVIFPKLHYGRDAMVGVAFFLCFMAKSGKKATQIRNQYPNYVIIKDKIQLTDDINIDQLLDGLDNKYQSFERNTEDGLKIYIDENWVHLRKSNTEPIIRIYAESMSQQTAETLANKIKMDMRSILKGEDC